MTVFQIINTIISVLFMVCYSYQALYAVIAVFVKKKQPVIELKDHSFAVMICARNESAVIGDLIDSIKKQTYDVSKISVFVIADNCTDNTAEVSRAKGAVVYERNNQELIGKGYALEELRGHIREDYSDGFDGYFVFDADNILAENYFEEMNKVISAGNDIVTSYRNTKNFGDNWVTGSYGIMFLRESQFLNYPRTVLKSGCFISGTGFYFSRKVSDEIGDWPFHMLTEDAEFTINRTLSGYKIVYCREAVFYDEQPTKFSQSWRQRLRWCKGYWQVFAGYGKSLIKGIFKGSFSCYDMSMAIMPAFILTSISIITNVAMILYALISGNGIVDALISFGLFVFSLYSTAFLLGTLITLTEWKNIKAPAYKKILYLFMFPIFMLSFSPIAIQSVFCKVEWKPITHTRSVESIEGKK